MQLLKAIDDFPLDGCKKTIGSSTCMQDIEKSFCKAVKQLGFPYVSYSLMQANEEENPTPHLNVAFTPIFSNFSNAWMTEYFEQKYYECDAVLRTLEYMPINAHLNHGTWSKARQLAVDSPKGENKRERNHYRQRVDEVFAGASRHGMNSGIYIIHRTGPVQIIISLASALSNDQLDKSFETSSLWNTLLALTILTNHGIVNTRGCDQCIKNVHIYGIHEITLTTAQKEILRFYAEKGNATLRDVATSQGTKTDTIKFHLKSIRAKLNKPRISGYALARFAIDHNLI